MQIVIDIPKDAYDYIMGSGYFPSNFNMISEIRNGTPLDKIRAEIEQAADKQYQIAMGVADLNKRYTHIQMENAYRHSLNIIDKHTEESEDKE